jgi:hypothetical protein
VKVGRSDLKELVEVLGENQGGANVVDDRGNVLHVQLQSRPTLRAKRREGKWRTAPC